MLGHPLFQKNKTPTDYEKAIRARDLLNRFKDPYTYDAKTREKIIALVKKHVDDNGSCRVGWVAEHIIGRPQQNHIHDKIAGKITRSIKYVKERNAHFPKDWNIYRNSARSAIILSRTSIVVTVIFSLLASYIAWLNYKKPSEAKVFLLQAGEKRDTARLQIATPKDTASHQKSP